jgi:hypothetical protein
MHKNMGRLMMVEEITIVSRTMPRSTPFTRHRTYGDMGDPVRRAREIQRHNSVGPNQRKSREKE